MSRTFPEPSSVVRPVDLRRTAAAIAASYGDDGAVVITSGKDGIRIGVHNLDADDLQDVLCVAIYYAVGKTLT